MTRNARSLGTILALAVLVVLPAPSAGAGTLDRRAIEERRAAGFEILEEARSAADAGTLEALVLAAAALDGIERIDAPPAVRSVLPAGTIALPSSLTEPIELLAGAVESAEAIAEDAVSDPAALARLEERVARALMPDRLIAQDGNLSSNQAARDAATDLERLAERVRGRSVDREAISSAALLLARTIDHVLPDLRAGARQLRGASGDDATEGCDVVNLVPHLCVGGPGANLYEEDAALLIDLGGDDVHSHSAGSAEPLDPYRPTLGNGLVVSITLDVEGDDTYSTQMPTSSGATAAQGAGRAGGIGMLIDDSGEDSYSIRATGTRAIPGTNPTDPDHPYSYHPQAYGQGFGALGGFGLLADGTGDDTYLLTDTSLSTGTTGEDGHGDRVIAAGGGAGLTGVGIAVDRAGNDSYRTVAHAPEPRVDGGSVFQSDAAAHSYGAATIGVGMFVDGSGNDDVLAAAATPPVAPDESRPLASPGDLGGGLLAPDGSAVSWGGGLGTFGGVGLALTGEGKTSWTFTAENRAPRGYAVEIHALGQGLIAGYGGLHDLGGDDAYHALATHHLDRVVEVDDSCACGGAVAKAVSSFNETGPAFSRVSGMGMGWLDGIGLLVDEAGSDRYEMRALASATAEAIDRRTAPHGSPDEEVRASAVARSPHAWVLGQGAATMEALGILFDGSGSDRYTSETSADARATSASDLGEGVAASVSGQAHSAVQGYTKLGGLAFGFTGMPITPYGELTDLGGADTYSSTNVNSSSASPATQVGHAPASTRLLAAADFGVAIFRDIDGGLSDSFTIVPASPACEGTRGIDVWRDCGQVLGLGVNR